ncbi:MAG TPA: TetR/AcrR family transcriptional regulator C-terminal domain-containing protein [Actinomycetota bacterium]
MSTKIEGGAETRAPLTRDRVLSTAVALADQDGIESLSMRKLAQALDVVPMALYRHVANKDELLNALVDVVVGEIDPPLEGTDWKTALRARILSARRALLRHPWASRLMESRTTPTPVVLGYLDSMIGMFRTGGFSLDLTHHALHAMGSRMFGFTQELFNDSSEADPDDEALFGAMADTHPHIFEIYTTISHDDRSVVGAGCDDQFEFEFALDLMLQGLEKLRDAPPISGT